MPATFGAYFTPIFTAYMVGYFCGSSLWAALFMMIPALMQIYVLDRRDPDGIWRAR